MGKVGYDSLEGILRVTELGKKQPDQLTVDVLTYHAALELEMDEFLARSLPHAEKLADGRLGYTHKIAVVRASWRGTDDSGDKLAHALVRFNHLRNAIAHNDTPKQIKAHLEKLHDATIALDGDENGDATPYALAIRICSFMGDDPGAGNAIKLMDQFDDIVNRQLPKALARKDDAQTKGA